MRSAESLSESSVVLVASRLSKRFAESVALADASLIVNTNEVVAVLGPSGCGKTTFLRIVAGLETADTGTVTIAGHLMNGVLPAERDVAMVFQDGGLYPHKSVHRNLSYALERQRTDRLRIDTQIRAVAATLGISSLLQKYPHQLSGGERQRVALGKALLRAPRVFLFDEPLSNLDAHLRRTLRVEIRRILFERAAPAIFVTHDQEEALSIGDRVAVMRAGQILQIDRPHDIYQRPVDLFVGQFIGSPAMNVVPISIRERHVLLQHEGPLGFSVPLADGDYLLGVRPEDVSFVRDSSDGLEARVDVVEARQPRSIVSYQSRYGPIAGEVTGSAPQAGSAVRLRFNANKILFFDTSSAARRVWPM